MRENSLIKFVVNRVGMRKTESYQFKVLCFVFRFVYSGEKRISESRIFVLKFPGRRHLE